MAESGAAQGSSESMEDILQSIKRIIEDDDTQEGAAAPAAAKADADVLDLTQVMADDGSVKGIAPAAPAKPAASAPAPAQDVIQSIDNMLANDTPAAALPEIKPAEAPTIKPAATPQAAPAPKTKVMEDGLVSDKAAQAAAAALKPIVDSAQKDYSVPHIPSPGLRGGSTVEDLILESLRPMLKAWLDEHLPTIVQKIVEKEVKRIVTFHQD